MDVIHFSGILSFWLELFCFIRTYRDTIGRLGGFGFGEKLLIWDLVKIEWEDSCALYI